MVIPVDFDQDAGRRPPARGWLKQVRDGRCVRMGANGTSTEGGGGGQPFSGWARERGDKNCERQSGDQEMVPKAKGPEETVQ